jgi:hypothetical protein
MHLIATSLTVLLLGACSSMSNDSEHAFVDPQPRFLHVPSADPGHERGLRQHQQAILDANAILQGINDARTDSRRLPEQAQ